MERKYQMQNWVDEKHGVVIGGIYDKCLLRAGVCDGPYIDILIPCNGWDRLIVNYIRNDKDPEKLEQLKQQVDVWLLLTK